MRAPLASTAMRKLWSRLDHSVRVALLAGVVLALASIPLHTFVALAVGLAAATVLGYLYPADATRVGVVVALPILTVAFITGLARGFSATVLVIFLACSLVLPVGLARMGASVREGRPAT